MYLFFLCVEFFADFQIKSSLQKNNIDEQCQHYESLPMLSHGCDTDIVSPPISNVAYYNGKL